MSDAHAAAAAEQKLPTGAATETGAAPSLSGASTATQKPVGGQNGSAATQAAQTPEEPPAPPATWPEDWRERLAGKDEQKLQRLRRFQSFDNYLRRTDDVENRLRAGQLKPVLGESASDAEIAEYRKAYGIPAEATPESYGVKLPDDFKPSDTDKADLGSWVSAMHSVHATPAQVQKGVETFLAMRQAAEQQLYDAAQQATINQRAEIKAEYGRDYENNIRLGNQFLVEHLGGEEKAQALTSLTLADGTKLGDHPDFVRLFVGAALENAGDLAIVMAASTAGVSIEQEYDRMLNQAYDPDPAKRKEYQSEEFQKRLLRLAGKVAERREKSAA